MPSPRRVAMMLELEWPYKRHAGIFAGAQQYAQENDWQSVVDEYADDTLPNQPGRRAPFDGIIARATRRLALRSRRLNVPVVNVWFSSPMAKSLPGVFADFDAVGRMRAEHLLSRGFRRFATLTSDADRAQAAELSAFSTTIAEAGYPCVTGSVPLQTATTAKKWRETERSIAGWMKHWRPPIGVYLGSEMHGRLLAQICRNRGWRVPDDVAIIAGWNEETFCEHVRPTLTSVEIGFERIGYEAARLLDQLMDAKNRAPGKRKDTKNDKPEQILLPAQGLIVRESTDFFAVEDELIRQALAFIAENFHRRIGPDAVARAVATEKRTLQRHFRKYLDRPIATEIRRVRIERAKRELAQTTRPLYEIARQVGFGPAMRMYEVFRREVGITPKEYRKQRRVNGQPS